MVNEHRCYLKNIYRESDAICHEDIKFEEKQKQYKLIVYIMSWLLCLTQNNFWLKYEQISLNHTVMSKYYKNQNFIWAFKNSNDKNKCIIVHSFPYEELKVNIL